MKVLGHACSGAALVVLLEMVLCAAAWGLDAGLAMWGWPAHAAVLMRSSVMVLGLMVVCGLMPAAGWVADVWRHRRGEP